MYLSCRYRIFKSTQIIRNQDSQLADCLNASLIWRMGRMSEAVALQVLHV